MTKEALVLSEKIQKLANRGVRKARTAARKAGVSIWDAKNGKLIQVNC